MARFQASTIQGRLWLVAVAVRLLAVVVLVAGPWTDQAAELEGWDAERFQEIADRDRPAWVESPVEYPPGSVVVLDGLAGDDVVATNRRLVILSALVEALTVLALWRVVSPRAAKAFLLLGLPLVPMGLLRLDMVATGVAVAAALALLAGRATGPDRIDDLELEAERGSGPDRHIATIAFGMLVAAGAMIKIWPALLVTGAWAVGRRGAAITATAIAGLVGLLWLALIGDGVQPLQQILSLRGATGWHVESLPGALTAVASGDEARMELNAFRIGTLDPTVVTVGRVLAVGMIAALTLSTPGGSATPSGPATPEQTRRRFCLVVLGSVAALIVTAPLLSPQFLLWLTPWGALLLADRDRSPNIGPIGDPVIVLLVVSLVLTGATLTVFGPGALGRPLPALLVTVRNLSLLALPPACLLELRRGVDRAACRPRRRTDRSAAIER